MDEMEETNEQIVEENTESLSMHFVFGLIG